MSNIPAETPGQKLRRLRKAAGLTLEQLAAQVGTAAGQLSKMENGERQITIGGADTWAERIAPALDVDPYIFADNAAIRISRVIGSAFAEEPAPAPASLGRVALPPGITDAENVFAALVADDSCDLLYPPGSILICRRVEDGDAIQPGTKTIVETYAENAADGEVMETLAGLLDVQVGGDVTLALRSNNRTLPPSVLISRPEEFGLADRARYGAELRPKNVSITTRPHDRARILGRVIWAMTPE